MKHRLNSWALVLAGGEGAHLHGLTRNVHGVRVPKQFCSLQGGPSLLQQALQRAATVAPMTRVCTIVAAQHRHWWTSMLSYLPQRNVIVQPENRGTAHGILLPLLRILERDAEATLVVLPADHFFRDEEVMIAALREASELAGSDRDALYLLGMVPEAADPELGYILPVSRSRERAVPVLRCIDKPGEVRARALIEDGALWNSRAMAASAATLLRLFEAGFRSTIRAMRDLNDAELELAYRQLPSVDFSRDVLAGHEELLRVLPVSPCGWTDLGTPKRVDLTVRGLAKDAVGPALRPYFPTHLNLAQQILRQGAP